MDYGIDIATELSDEFVRPLVEEAATELAKKLDTGEGTTEITAYDVAGAGPRRWRPRRPPHWACEMIVSFELVPSNDGLEAKATADAVDALRRIYELHDGDGAAVGELLYAIDKAARRG